MLTMIHAEACGIRLGMLASFCQDFCINWLDLLVLSFLLVSSFSAISLSSLVGQSWDGPVV